MGLPGCDEAENALMLTPEAFRARALGPAEHLYSGYTISLAASGMLACRPTSYNNVLERMCENL